jgi:uncharacterized protein Yka (UPF0111/DUF47 family)
MSQIRQLAQAIDTVANCMKELGEAIYERIIKESDRITKLEKEIEQLKREPYKSFKQKIKDKL